MLSKLALTATLAAVGSVLLTVWLFRPSSIQSGEAPLVPVAPGGPILLVTDRTANVNFDAYLAEMLRTEGWTAFATRDVTELTPQTLADTRLMVLGWSTAVTADVTRMLESFVRAGGTLVCLRPRAQLQSVTGVAEERTEQRYVELAVAGDATADRAVVQVFGETVGLRPVAGTTIIARFASSSGERSESAAVTMHQFGEGRAVTFGFDPARTMAYLRQGDPSWRGEERDGAPGPRATDAFAGWVDLARANRPQADDHLRLLSAVIDMLLGEQGGEPRLWYFPAGEPAVLVVTGDAHATTAAAMQEGIDLVERAGGRMTIYYDPPAASSPRRRAVRRAWRDLRGWWSPTFTLPPTARTVAEWRRRGHEIGPHPVIDERDVTGSYQRSVEGFSDEGLGSHFSTVRTHAVFWKGWVASAQTESTFGFGLTMDYYHSGPWLRRANGEWLHSNFTGSFLPMRIVDQDGKVLGIRQLTTTMADEQLLASAYDGWEGLNADGAISVSRNVLERTTAAAGIPVLQFHLDFLEPGHPLRTTITQWISRSLAVAKTNGIPIWNAAQLLAFEGCREQTRVTGTKWSTSAHLTFQVEQSGTAACAVTVIIPTRSEPTIAIDATVDGRPAGESLVRRGSRQLLMLPPGSHAVAITFSAPPGAARE